MLTRVALSVLLLLAAAGFPAAAQNREAPARRDSAAPAPQKRPVLSPRDSVTLRLDTNVISVNYGRPSRRGRVIMGELVPWNQVWRTGANQATHLRTNFDMTLGEVPVPRGLYTLWTLPSTGGWKFILNKQTGQWGTNYDERQDLARFGATVERLSSPVDTFTIALERTGATSGRLVLSWENTRVWAPFARNDRIRPLSPLDSTEARIDGKRVKVVYSKPFMRGRTIWGTVVPFDSVWRTGANSPTTLTTEGDLRLGDLALPAGSYILQSFPRKDSFTLIVGRRAQVQGPMPDSLVVGKVALTLQTPASAVDPFRIQLVPNGQDAAVLRVGWADRVYEIDVHR